jgi:hypothetical protein
MGETLLRAEYSVDESSVTSSVQCGRVSMKSTLQCGGVNCDEQSTM